MVTTTRRIEFQWAWTNIRYHERFRKWTGPLSKGDSCFVVYGPVGITFSEPLPRASATPSEQKPKTSPLRLISKTPSF
ncbi:hypothetical protein L2E82_02768 [Cichorium intybus]|uniref:Uncharacterized protein n=1 Tax=Cichorium intybus TaxID=13427 RepID=A0ACB9H2K1_CICIN|nr:hypothetical protein L2E82_02768 [Cichorium intybus]